MTLGAIAQLVERLNGIQEVSGSTPLSSTNKAPRVTPAGLFQFEFDVGSGQPPTAAVKVTPSARATPNNVVNRGSPSWLSDL